MYNKGELKIVELQQSNIWDRKKINLFIDSILIGIPVPSIVLAIVNNEKYIIDGFQRIKTIYDFVFKGSNLNDNKAYKLSDSESINKKWRGKAFCELDPEDQRKILETTIHTIVLEHKNTKENDTLLHNIFERYNRSVFKRDPT